MTQANQNAKFFFINRSELEGRFDATAYRKSSIFDSKKYPIYKLSEVAYVNPNTTFDKLDKENVISFVPMEAVSDINGIIKRFQTKKVSESKSFTRFKDNDLIWAKITPCMQNGKSAVVRNTINGYACGSTEFFIIRPKNENILSDYIHFFLRDKKVLKDAQNYFGGSAGQQRVSKDFLLNFKIPLPPLEVQKVIVEKIKTAYTQKQQKEAQAQELLKSIDTYLLNELGITVPEKDNSIESRMFIVNFSEVTGSRFDGYYYQEDFITFFGLLKKSKYSVLTLKQISKKITSGITPLSGGDAYTSSNEGIPFVRSGNINIDGDLDFDDLLYLKPEIHNTTMKSSKLLKNDLMIAIVGATIGQVGIYLDNREANINQAIALIRLKDGNLYNPFYIKEVTKSSIGQYNLNRLKRPVARANINLEEISTMQLIVPPIEVQNKLVKYIQEIRNQANQLQAEAKQILEEAKQEVEKMIIGD